MQYFSQIGQDKYYIENISKGSRNGVFLDVGANDGIFESNTASLELFYGWTGICIEANPLLIDSLKKNRLSSTIINCAIWDLEGEIELERTNANTNGIRGDLLSRINNLDRNENYFTNNFNENSDTVKVKSRRLDRVIQETLGVNSVIDYMSLDIEGAEIEALKTINFDIVDIRFMTIEHGYRPGYLAEIQNFLHFYGFKTHRINQWDVEFTK
jgi:FkbM family methyltransferase